MNNLFAIGDRDIGQVIVGALLDFVFKVMVRIYKDIINILLRLNKECLGEVKVCERWEAPGRWSWLSEVKQGTGSAYQSERHCRLYFDDMLFGMVA